MTTVTITTQSEYAARTRLAMAGLGTEAAGQMIAEARDAAMPTEARTAALGITPREITRVPFVHRVSYTPGHRTEAGYVPGGYTVEVPADIRATWAVGDGATLHYWTDAHAYTVIRVTRTTITIQRDTATPDPAWRPDFTPGGFFGHTANDRDRTYTYAPDPEGVTRTVRLTKKGWTAGGQHVSKGRHEFYDSNF